MNTQNLKLRIILIFILSMAVFVMADFDYYTHAAVNEEEKEEELEDLGEELEKLEKKEKKYRDIINLKQKEQDIINAQIRKLEEENKKVETNIEQNEEEIENLTGEIDRTKSEIKQKETYIDLQKKILIRFIREKYQSYSKDTEHFTILNIAGTQKRAHSDNISHATTKIGDFVQKIHNEQEQLKKDQEELEDKSKRIQDAKYELEQRSEYLQGSQNYKRVLATQVNAEEDTYQNKLSKVLEEQLAIQQEISRLATDQIGNFSMADLPSKKEADFELPVKDPFVKTQGYGKTSFSSYYKGGLHNGVDYVAKGSQSIMSVADGKVKATGNMGKYGYGKWVAIDHGNGLVTLYGHFSSVSVSRGDKVDQGDKIGKMGNTGFSTGPHLHFSVFAGSTFAIVESSSVSGVYIPTGATVNPEMYL